MPLVCRIEFSARLLTALAVVACWLSAPVQAQEDEWRRLRAEAAELAKSDAADRALDVALQALYVAERTFGPEHPAVGASQSGVAEAFAALGNFTEAARYLERSLAIAEKALGPVHAVVAEGRYRLADAYFVQRKFALAEPSYSRALTIWEAIHGPDHIEVARALHGLARLREVMGQYSGTDALAVRALLIKEIALGPEHPGIADSMSLLALIYLRQAQYSRAEELYRRELALHERTSPPVLKDIAGSLNGLASALKSQGRYAEAEQTFRRSLSSYEQAFGSDSPRIVRSLNNLGTLLLERGRHAEARPLLMRSLEIAERTRQQSDPELLFLARINLGTSYFKQGLYAEAEPLIQSALRLARDTFGNEHPNVALALFNLGSIRQARAQYAEAEALYDQALAMKEKRLGLNHPDVASVLKGLAQVSIAQGRHAEAAALLERAKGVEESSLGPEHPGVAESLSVLASIRQAQGQHEAAEALFRRALTIREKALGPDHEDVAVSLNNLAVTYMMQGLYQRAEPLQKRALAIAERSAGKQDAVALLLGNLGQGYSRTGNYEKAAATLKRAVETAEKSLSPDHPLVATYLNNLAGNYLRRDHFLDALPLLQRAFNIFLQAYGPAHAEVANVLNNLATVNLRVGNAEQAEKTYAYALETFEKAVGKDHPYVANALNGLALSYKDQGKLAEALPPARRASGIYRRRIVAGGTSDFAIREASANREGFLGHLAILSKSRSASQADDTADEALQIAQLMQASGTASAVAKMAARFAAGDDALATLVKRKQDNLDQLGRLDQMLIGALSKAPSERDAVAEQRWQDEIARLRSEVESTDAELSRKFPNYQELTRVEPVTLGELRSLLRPDEALLAYAIDDDSYAFVVSRQGVEWIALSVEAAGISSRIRKIRAALEPDASSGLKPVDVQSLHELYRLLFAPVLPHLKDSKHILLVQGGPLQSLPFGMLVASPPTAIVNPADYRKVDWLSTRYATTVLPSAGSLRSLRVFAKGATATEPFAGFGDPLVGLDSGASRTRRAQPEMAALFRTNSVAAMSVFDAQKVHVADADAIRKLDRLPETAEELREMAQTLRAGPESIWLGARATESNLKNLDLTRYRTVVFATHGLMAGDVTGIGEPGLILTPPARSSMEDDGYLAASEIARLKMNADWVILSACNTAAPDGTPGAEGLSGLAKAFLYAGARALLVSHWPVASEATVPLTTTMLRLYETTPGLSKAEAHRRAMISLMRSTANPEYAHPMFWAPFVVVGDGAGAAEARSGGTRTDPKTGVAPLSRKTMSWHD